MKGRRGGGARDGAKPCTRHHQRARVGARRSPGEPGGQQPTSRGSTLPRATGSHRRGDRSREDAGGDGQLTVSSFARSVSRLPAASRRPGGAFAPASAALHAGFPPPRPPRAAGPGAPPPLPDSDCPRPPGIRTPQLRALLRARRRWRRLYSPGGRRRHICIQGGVWTQPKPAGWGRAETFDLTVRVRSRPPSLKEKRARL